jgi:ABC-type glutathione transport system ATPase component
MAMFQTSKTGSETLIRVEGLRKYFPVRAGVLQRVEGWVQAVDDVSFTIRKGETLGMVGESGCGKTTIGRTMLRLTEPTAGSVYYNDVDVFGLKGADLKAMRRNMQIIFQDPYASLDPRMPIGESVMEGLRIHNIGDPKQRYQNPGNVAKGWPGGLPRPPLPARVFRRPAPAHWHRPRPGSFPQLYRLR